MLNPVAPQKSISEIKKLLQFMTDERFKNDTPIALFLWGNPGVGKTKMIEEFCQSRKIKFENFKLSQENPITVVGLYAINNQNKQTERYFNERIAEMIEEDKKGNITVLFFDELVQGINTIPAIWELINERRLGKYKFKHLRIIAASNYLEQYVAYIDNAFWSRFMHVNVEPTVMEIATYISSNCKGKQVPLFLLQNPNKKYDDTNFTMVINPRKWEYVQHMIDKDFETFKIFAEAFHPYVQELALTIEQMKEIMQFKDMIKNPDLILQAYASKKALDRFSYYNFLLNLGAKGGLNEYFEETVEALKYVANKNDLIKTEVKIRLGLEDILAIDQLTKNHRTSPKYHDFISILDYRF